MLNSRLESDKEEEKRTCTPRLPLRAQSAGSTQGTGGRVHSEGRGQGPVRAQGAGSTARAGARVHARLPIIRLRLPPLRCVSWYKLIVVMHGNDLLPDFWRGAWERTSKSALGQFALVIWHG